MIQMTGMIFELRRSPGAYERCPDFKNVAKGLAIWVDGAPDWFLEECETWDQKQRNA